MAAGIGTVRIRGLRETQRAFAKMALGIRAELRLHLRKIAEPVAATAKDKLARYDGISLGTIGPRTSVLGAFVTQRARKVTGRRPDFGALQMQEGLIPALQEHAEDIEREALDALDAITREAGFH